MADLYRPIAAGDYLVYADGRVFSVLRGIFLKPQWKGRGYLAVCIKGRLQYVHQLVLEAFAGARPKGGVARHLDGDLANNCLENLTWGTQQENVADTSRHGRKAAGERCGRSKLTWDEVHSIRSSALPVAVLAAQHGVSIVCIYDIKNNKTWRTEAVCLGA